MKFLEDSPEFIDFDEEDNTYIVTCHECNGQFVLTEDDDLSKCPLCNIKFD